MNILVATDGTLDPARVTDVVSRWYRDGDVVVVFTAVNVPRDFLRRLGDKGVKEAAHIALEAGQTLGAGDKAAERLIQAIPIQERPPSDSPVLAALENSAHACTDPIVKALESHSIKAKAMWRTSEYRTARTVISAIHELDAGLLIIGSHGGGRFEGKLGSTGTKLVRHAPTTVLVLRDQDEPE